MRKDNWSARRKGKKEESSGVEKKRLWRRGADEKNNVKGEKNKLRR